MLVFFKSCIKLNQSIGIISFSNTLLLAKSHGLLAHPSHYFSKSLLIALW